MLAYLKGEIREKELTSGQADRMVLDVGGIGFEVMVSKRTLLTQGAVGERTIMPVSLIIRETEWTLFGFGSQDERELFAILQTVTGIGPKLALAVVGTLGPLVVVVGLLGVTVFIAVVVAPITFTRGRSHRAFFGGRRTTLVIAVVVHDIALFGRYAARTRTSILAVVPGVVAAAVRTVMTMEQSAEAAAVAATMEGICGRGHC